MNNNGLPCPCYKCKDRYVGCHSVCPLYAKFQEDNEAIKKRQRDEASKAFYSMKTLKRTRY